MGKLYMADLGKLYYDQHQQEFQLSAIEEDYWKGFQDDFLVLTGAKATNELGLTKDELCMATGNMDRFVKNILTAVSKLSAANDIEAFVAGAYAFGWQTYYASNETASYYAIRNKATKRINSWLSLSDKQKLGSAADKAEYATFILEKYDTGEIYKELGSTDAYAVQEKLKQIAKIGLTRLFTKQIGNLFNTDLVMSNSDGRKQFLRALNYSQTLVINGTQINPLYAFDGFSCQWAGALAAQQKAAQAQARAAAKAAKATSAKNTSATTSGSAANSNTSTTGNGSGNSWKDQGALSSKAIGLVNSTKSTVSSSIVYYIAYNNPNPSNSKEYRAFIKPLAGKYAVSNDTTKALIGNGSNYGDFVCFFATAVEAGTFADALAANANVARTDLVIAKAKTDNNGYFTIKTDCGNVLARARGFNEALELTEGADIEKVEHASPDFKHMTDEEFDEYADTFYSFN